MTDTKKSARKGKPAGPFSDEMLDQLLAQCAGNDAESLLGESGLIGQLKKQLAQRMLAAELSHHLDTQAANANVSSGANHPTAVAPRPSSPRLASYSWTFHATAWPPLNPPLWQNINVD